MREIIFDTETTGIRPEDGERIIEIGALEFVNRFPTGVSFHEYLNPETRPVDPGAFRVHGLSNEFLADKKTFAEIAPAFLEFIEGAQLVAHNAPFDINFLNHEFARIGAPAIGPERVIDTLDLARRKHPLAQNSLDRLCERYGIDNSRRTYHGALLDAELLSEVYIELLGGRQTSLELVDAGNGAGYGVRLAEPATRPERPAPLPPRLTADDLAAHARFVETLGENAVWLRYEDVPS